MGRLLLRAARVITPLEAFAPGAVLIDGTKIQGLGPVAAVPQPRGIEQLDLGDITLVPGFIDVHIHGSAGHSAMDGSAAIAKIAQALPAYGVTSWLPTLTARESLAQTAEVVGAALEGAAMAEGAEPVGLHLEGPFLSPRRPGALRREWFQQPSLEFLDGLLTAGAGRIRLMTLAPELPGALDLVRRLASQGVTASIGHSDASAEQAQAGIAAGIRHATHTYNAMRPLLQRDPGVVGAVFADDAVRAELIADGVHVDPVAMRALIHAKSPYRVALITDAVAPAGLGDGAFTFEGRPIQVTRGKATLADGTIAGSVGTFDANVRRIVQECRVSLRDALIMAALTPARAIGLTGRKGSLAAGHDADIVALDSALRVRLTIARGRIVYRA